ncbi:MULTISPECIES: ABC transporter permease [Cryobacterium]|uniref:ABC transporter permease n=1 Tax=Cryobacterium zongtaii TaxID=1259217 RepID=A0A2S3ZL63_9MICO|nr:MULTISPECIES: ABC transporter permease [Cryobacterium]POH63082.1 ABC transporter permease [Cryobacterium zongtaii]POH68800.1 ABC transporter permease [Cryobacterium zongtaii]TFC47560.1 ABC transporter permease [Cryobacterium sp. TMN-39-2]
MNRLLSNVVGSFVEAWQELRIHKTRVMLSLIGVAVAVCAITTVVGLGAVAQQSIVEQNERSGGRSATLSLYAGSNDGTAIDPDVMQEFWDTSLERYSIDYASRVLYTTQTVQFTDGAVPVQAIGVDQPYGTMHRVTLTEGEWFSVDDAERLAPAVLVNQIFWDRLGRPDLATHPTTTLLGATPTTAVITGVYPVSVWETEPAMYLLMDTITALTPADQLAASGSTPNYELWVPPEISEDLIVALQRDAQGALGAGTNVSVSRQDYAAYNEDPFASIKLLVGGVAGLVLLLGALGLVNIALVTLKQRIREIGVRRSFGATAGRVFFSVMMESIVATLVAGVVGVIGAVLIVTNPMLQEFISQGMVTDFPPFPVEAAILGLVCATVVGALAGLLPALVAVRVKVIDAIRY